MIVIYGLLLLIFMPLIVCTILAIAAFICNIILILLEYQIKKDENEIKEIQKRKEEIEKRISQLCKN